MKPMYLDVKAAQSVCSLGKTKLYEMMQRGDLQFRHEGRKRLISVSSIEKYFGLKIDA